MSENREFENKFPDFHQQPADSSKETSLVCLGDAGVEELIPDWEKRIRGCIDKLLVLQEEGLRTVDRSDYSVYTGTSGIALLYLRLYERLDCRDRSSNWLAKCLDLLEPSLCRLKRRKCSFLCGDAGVLAVAAVVYKEIGKAKESDSCIKQLHGYGRFVVEDAEIPDELLFGRAGYLYSLLFIGKHFGPGVVDQELLAQVFHSIVKSGESLAKHLKSHTPLMYVWHDSYYLGAAHGLAGIYFTLMRTPVFERDKRVRELVKRAVDYMITLRFPSGNYPSSLKTGASDRLLHWCHGAPGFIHMFLQAYKVFGEERYLNEAFGCADVIWKRGLLCKGYGLCHGVAGNGYAFLMLWQTTKDPKYLYRALKFAEWIFDYGKHGCRTADRPYSLFEGLAGTVYYLVDLLRPAEAEFPAFY